jgi:hypothetical protein
MWRLLLLLLLTALAMKSIGPAVTALRLGTRVGGHNALLPLTAQPDRTTTEQSKMLGCPSEVGSGFVGQSIERC